MVSFILIRHGESKDNLRQVWAGWKDSPLSNHGMRQAEALTDDFCRMKMSFSSIYTSDLQRAKFTAGAVKSKQTSRDAPLNEVELLREQNFGAGEGKPISKMEKGISVKAHYAKGKFPAMHTRQQKFPGGESLDEMAQRAEAVVDDIITREVLKENADGDVRIVAIFSHGLFIAELIAAIIRRDTDNKNSVDIRDLRGMRNTGWTRLEVTQKLDNGGQSSSVPVATSWTVRMNGINRHAHLSNLHRQKGGIGSLAHDPAQQDIRAFLGGKQKSGVNPLPKVNPY